MNPAELWELLQNARREDAETIAALQRGIDALTERVEVLENPSAARGYATVVPIGDFWSRKV